MQTRLLVDVIGTLLILDGQRHLTVKTDDRAGLAKVRSYADAFIEDEALAVVMCATHLFEILQDTAVELQHIGITLHGHERACLLAADTAGTEHHDGLRLEFGGKLLHRRGEIPEIPDLRHDRPFERAHADLVFITRVEQRHRPAFVQPLLELLRRDLGGWTAGGIDAFDTESDDLLLDLHEHALERLIRTRTLLGRNTRETWHSPDDA